MIELKNVSRKFFEGKPNEVAALRGINLTVSDGDMLAIMGPSGSGKSTLLHILALLDSHYSGELIYDGRDISKLGDTEKSSLRNHEIGLVMQDYGLVGEMTAQENVEIPLIVAGIGKKEARARSREALERVGMAHKSGYNANLLSGGERQRVAVARAVVMNAKVLLADEPTGAVDTKITGEIMDLLKTLNQSGVTVIIVTHDVNVANLCTRKINIVDGTIE